MLRSCLASLIVVVTVGSAGILAQVYATTTEKERRSDLCDFNSTSATKVYATTTFTCDEIHTISELFTTVMSACVIPLAATAAYLWARASSPLLRRAAFYATCSWFVHLVVVPQTTLNFKVSYGFVTPLFWQVWFSLCMLMGFFIGPVCSMFLLVRVVVKWKEQF